MAVLNCLLWRLYKYNIILYLCKRVIHDYGVIIRNDKLWKNDLGFRIIIRHMLLEAFKCFFTGWGGAKNIKWCFYSLAMSRYTKINCLKAILIKSIASIACRTKCGLAPYSACWAFLTLLLDVDCPCFH